MQVSSALPALAILFALITTVLVWLDGADTGRRNVITVTGSILTAATVIAMVPGALQSKVYSSFILRLLPGASLAFKADPLAMIFAIVASVMWVIVNIYSIGYMEHEHEKHRFFTFFSMAIFAALGIAFSANLITLFIFYELLTVSTYPLVTHEGNAEAKKAGVKYLIYTMGAGGMLLAAILITYGLTGTLEFSKVPIFAGTTAAPMILRTVFMLFLVGFGVKAALMPLHNWLPSAMVAPTPVSTLLHAVAVVKAGAFGIIRLIYFVYGPREMRSLHLDIVVIAIASFTIVVASIIAVKQDNLKRRLAYSTIGQLSYIVLGAALLSPAALIAAAVHIANHAVTKGTLFMCAGVIAEETGVKEISKMKGIAKRLPVTMAIFSLAALGMIGIPPLAGFVSKWLLVSTAGSVNQPVLVMIFMLSSILNAVYFLPIIYTAYFGKQSEEFSPSKKRMESANTMIYAITTTAALTVFLGVFASSPGLPLSLARMAAKLLGGVF